MLARGGQNLKKSAIGKWTQMVNSVCVCVCVYKKTSRKGFECFIFGAETIRILILDNADIDVTVYEILSRYGK